MDTQREVSMVGTQTASGRRQAWRRGESDDVSRDVAGLSALNTRTLTQRWQSLFDAGPPPGLGRALLVRVLAYRIQRVSRFELAGRSAAFLTNRLDYSGKA